VLSVSLILLVTAPSGESEELDPYRLTCTKDSHLTVGHAVEVIGKVDGNLHVKVQAATDFGTSIGMLLSLLLLFFV
jgi:hypothetical protein